MASLLVTAGIVFVVFFVATLMLVYGYARYRSGGSSSTSGSRQSKGARKEG